MRRRSRVPRYVIMPPTGVERRSANSSRNSVSGATFIEVEGARLSEEMILDEVDPHLLRHLELLLRLDPFGDDASGRVVPQALHYVVQKIPKLLGSHRP